MKISQYFLIAVALLVLATAGRRAAALDFDNTGLYPEPSDFVTGEAELLGKLRSGEPAQKAVACKQLAIHGTKAAVPEVAKLLSDPQLSSWARITLEAIPDPACDQALLDAAKTLDGELLIGVINSIGVRRSPGAAEHLAHRLQQGPQNAGAAAAAAIALGRLGDDASLAALRGALKSSPAPVLDAVAEACTLCAERRLAEGKADAAAEIYDELRSLELPKQRMLEAIRGSIVAHGAAGIPLLVEQLKAEDEDFFRIGLSTARELQEPKVTEALAGELGGASPDRAALLLVAIGDRNDSLPPAVLAAAKGGDQQVQIAAIGVLGRHADASSLPTLLQAAGAASGEVAEAARAAIAAMPGEQVDSQLIAQLTQLEGKPLAALIEVIGLRRVDAAEHLIQAARHRDPAVRRAALAALGETVDPEHLGVLITSVLSTEHDDAEAAVAALRAAAVRMPDRDATAAQLAAALSKATPAAKAQILEILGSVGGEKALQTIAATVQAGDVKLQDVGTRVLGEWMTADAAPVLLELSKDPAVTKFQIRALRGYLRIARQFAMSDDERVAMAEQALATATRPEEQTLALDTLKRAPTAAALDVAVKARELPGLEETANQTAMTIIQRLAEHGSDPAALLAKIGQKPMKIEIVKAQYGSQESKRDVTKIVQEHVRGLPVITLSGSFNKSFGGDPAPNAPKQLTLEYRIDDRPGATVIAENAPIVLPMPQ